MSWLVAAPDVKRNVLDALRQRLCSSDNFKADKISLSHHPFTNQELDALLKGGIPTGMITELAGEAGVGKTQLCLQLLLNVQRHREEGGLDSGALYIYTEGSAQPLLMRCWQMAELRGWEGTCMNRIMVRDDVGTGQELLDALESAEQQILTVETEASNCIRLIVVDSIAHLFRTATDVPGARHYGMRSETFQKVSNKLKQLAYAYQLAVVVTNQITDYFDDQRNTFDRKDTSTGGAAMITSGREVLPSLGLSWSNCINQRLLLSRCQAQTAGTTSPGVRALRVAFSPNLPSTQQRFVVERAGIRGLTAAEQYTAHAPTALFNSNQPASNKELNSPNALAAATAKEQPLTGPAGSLPEMQAGHRRGESLPASSHVEASRDGLASGGAAAAGSAVSSAPYSACGAAASSKPDGQRHRGGTSHQAANAGVNNAQANQETRFEYSEEDDGPCMLGTGVFAT